MVRAARDFVIVIPVADRPEHLNDCLNSLAELMRHHPYAGAVRVLVVDDSLDMDNQTRHADIARRFSQAGLGVDMLGQAEQRALVESLPAELRARLAGVLGDGASYARKGASITRNIAYLWLRRLQKDGRPRLFWFLDSDQEFRVSVDTGDGEAQPYAIDYLGSLERIFSETPTRILTGKVVGDPPVSPAVMAGHFVDDVAAFVAEMAGLDPHAACAFHGAARHADDAAYHDMADLFGFRSGGQTFRYRCTLPGQHDNAACFADFAARLGRFFDGEHPTRRSYYVAEDLMASVKPARTVYTGNYVATPEALEWFIPFAGLKLRMAGPTLGRIVKAEIGGAFVSANLPMLHKRTQGDSGRSECRPGVDRQAAAVDLSGEFERQYHGDVMLFSVERLTHEGYPARTPERARIAATVGAVEADMRLRYQERQTATAARIEALAQGFEAAMRDSRLVDEHAPVDAFRRFIADLRHNFGPESPAMRGLDDPARRDTRLGAIVDAIAAYGDTRAAWLQALEGVSP
jgi:hypothetical protein